MAELNPWFINGGEPNHLLSGMILQVGILPTGMILGYPPWN